MTIVGSVGWQSDILLCLFLLVDEGFDELFNGKENDHIESEVHDVMIVKVTCGVYRMPNSIDSLAEILKKYVRGLTHINILRGLGKLY
nr:7495_t:CDS:2 [Entrophospora candida]